MMCENNVRFNMLADFYEFTMSNGYFEKGKRDEIVYFDMFFRKIPDGGGFAIAAGLEQVVDYMENLKFDSDEIEFLRSKGIFSEEFLKYLETFEFSCDVYAVPEGTPIFPGEPILIVRRSRNSGSAAGDNGAFDNKPSVAYRYKGISHCACRAGARRQ